MDAIGRSRQKDLPAAAGQLRRALWHADAAPPPPPPAAWLASLQPAGRWARGGETGPTDADTGAGGDGAAAQVPAATKPIISRHASAIYCLKISPMGPLTKRMSRTEGLSQLLGKHLGCNERHRLFLHTLHRCVNECFVEGEGTVAIQAMLRGTGSTGCAAAPLAAEAKQRATSEAVQRLQATVEDECLQVQPSACASCGTRNPVCSQAARYFLLLATEHTHDVVLGMFHQIAAGTRMCEHDRRPEVFCQHAQAQSADLRLEVLPAGAAADSLLVRVSAAGGADAAASDATLAEAPRGAKQLSPEQRVMVVRLSAAYPMVAAAAEFRPAGSDADPAQVRRCKRSAVSNAGYQSRAVAARPWGSMPLFAFCHCLSGISMSHEPRALHPRLQVEALREAFRELMCDVSSSAWTLSSLARQWQAAVLSAADPEEGAQPMAIEA